MFLPFSEALQSYNVSAVQRLIEAGFQVNQADANGKWPLAEAITFLFSRTIVGGHEGKKELLLQIIDLLISAQANPNLITLNQEPVLFYLCEQAHDVLRMFGPEEETKQREELAYIMINKLFLTIHGIDLNVRDDQLKTPLLHSLTLCNKRIAKRLLELGADATVVSSRGQTVLHAAASSEDVELMQQLLSKQPHVNSEDSRQLRPLDYASHPDILLLLLKSGATSLHRSLFDYFQIAQQKNHSELLNYLFENGLLSFRDAYGNCALQFVRSLEMAEQLFEKGIQIRPHTFSLFQILLPLTDHLAYYRLLHQHGADFSLTHEGNTLLHEQIFSGVGCVEALIGFGVPINACNSSQETALHLALHHGLFEEAKYLLDHGIDEALRDHRQQVALEKIIWLSLFFRKSSPEICVEVIQRLLQKLVGLPINAQELLLIAIQTNSLILVKDLYQRGARLDAREPNGTALDLAAQRDRVEILEWMLAQIDSTLYEELLREALGQAVMYLNVGCVALLIRQKSHLMERKNRGGQTLLFEFSSSLDSSLGGRFSSVEEKYSAAVKVLDVLLKGGMRLDQPHLMEEFIDYRGSHWSIIALLISHGTPLPSNKQQVMQLASWAVKFDDHEALSYIIEGNLSQLWVQDLLAHVALEVCERNDFDLFNALLAWGLDLNRPLLGYRVDHNFCYLWDRISFNESISEVQKEKWLCVFIQAGMALHLPARSSLLHRAAKQGWLAVMELLLQSGRGFSIDLLSRDLDGREMQQTPLQVSIEHKQIASTQFLLERGANPLVLNRENKNLLHIICEGGLIELLPHIFKTEIDKNAEYKALFISLRAVHLAAFYEKREIAERMVGALLDENVMVDMTLLILMIKKQFSIDLISRVLLRLSKADLDYRIIHQAVESNYLQVVKMLLKMYPEMRDFPNFQGCTPLHLASAPNRMELFNYLIEQGAQVQVCDHEGFTVTMHAIFHGTYRELNLLPPSEVNVEELYRLKAQLIERPEFARPSETTSFDLSIHCYKLISLFKEANLALKFISQHQNIQSKQPIHDLCLFHLPTIPIQYTSGWIKLFFDHGKELTPYLHLAGRIEQLLNRAPNSLEEVKQISSKIKYSREIENPELADLFYPYNIPEKAFSRILDQYKPKQTSLIPDFMIDGKDFNEPRFYLKKLPDRDLRGFVLGEMTHCCQSAGGQGESCAMHGMSSPYGGFYLVFKRNKEKEISNFRKIVDIAMRVETKEGFLDSFQTKSQRQKYEKISLAYPTLKELRHYLRRELVKLEEDELVAQMWTWISQNGGLVIDSWERLRSKMIVYVLLF